jgi:hypothetical protein
MRKKGYQKYQPTFINKLCDHDMDVWWQACATSLHAFPTLAYHRNVILTDEYAIYLSARFQNVYIWVKQNPHFFEELELLSHWLIPESDNMGLLNCNFATRQHTSPLCC